MMVSAAGARVQECLDAAKHDVPLAETLLVVVGRGSSDPDANSNVAKVTRLLVEGFGFGWGETVYSGVTFPLVEPGLLHAVKLGFRRVVVVPYFLFSGVLVSRIRQHTELVAAASPWPRWSWRLDPRSLDPPPPREFRPGVRHAPLHPGTPERELRRPTPSTGPPPAPGRNRSVNPFRPCTCSEQRGCRSWHARLQKAWREWPAPW